MTHGGFRNIGCDILALVEKTGYHGTTEDHARSILKEKQFITSTKDTEWLGRGVYFFKHARHAEFWAKAECRKSKNIGQQPKVLKASLKCDESQVFDLDNPANLYSMNDFLKQYFKRVGATRHVDFDKITNEQKWCLSCNLYRYFHTDIAITIYTFVSLTAKEGYSGFRTTQTQLCVSDHKKEIIKTIEEWEGEG